MMMMMMMMMMMIIIIIIVIINVKIKFTLEKGHDSPNGEQNFSSTLSLT